MEAKFFRLTGVEVYHVVVLNPSNGCKISEVLRVDVAFVAHIQKFVEVDEVKVFAFGQVLP